jgi:LacI family transcriptional regulator
LVHATLAQALLLETRSYVLSIKIKEIAGLCGVSVGTVDRALHNRPEINAETKEKVLSIARKLKYRPHHLASSLAKGSSMTIGVLVYDLRNYFFSQLVEVIEAKAMEQNYYVNLMLSHGDRKQEIDYLDHMRSLNVDGIILVAANTGAEFDKHLNSIKTPIVTVGNRVSKRRVWVGLNDRKAMRDAVLFICSKGYRRIIYVGPQIAAYDPKSLLTTDQRLLGYRESLMENSKLGSPRLVDRSEMDRILDVLCLSDSPRTCILCSADIEALEILKVLKENGIDIPRHVGLMGFDNIDVLRYITPRLTTVAYPISGIGETAFKYLIEQIKGNPVQSITLGHRIIEGESV